MTGLRAHSSTPAEWGMSPCQTPELTLPVTTPSVSCKRRLLGKANRAVLAAGGALNLESGGPGSGPPSLLGNHVALGKFTASPWTPDASASSEMADQLAVAAQVAEGRTPRLPLSSTGETATMD